MAEQKKDLNLTEFAHSIREELGMGKAESVRQLNIVFDRLRDLVADGGSVQIVNFGKFYAKEQKACQKKMKMNGEEKIIDVPAKLRGSFAPAKAYKDAPVK